LGLKLRTDLDIQPVHYRGQRVLLVSDRLGLIKNPVILQGEALEILMLIDGSRDEKDIQYEFLRRRGYSLSGAELVSRILADFERLLILDTPEYRASKRRLVEEFLGLPVREACLAGEAYPAESEALKDYLSRLLERERRPPEVEREMASGFVPRVLLAPHIDLKAGARLYSLAYSCLAGMTYERVLILGTGHALEEGFLSLTEKDFRTPLGIVTTDKKEVRKIKEAGGNLMAPDDLAHRKEHSIEFQLIFLQQVLARPFSIVPIICGSVHSWLKKVNRASEIPGMESVIEVLRQMAADSSTLVVAGVDFCHIGPKFGHQQTASQLKGAAVAFDHDIIEALLHRQVEAFWKLHRETGDRFNVCGFPVLAVLLEIIPENLRGYLLGYDLSQETASQSAVSFASVVYF
jgi:AmmeMemoRadiSam system protein B